MAGKGVHLSTRMQDEEDETTASCDEGVSQDSSVFMLLFRQCVKPGESTVDIDVLMEFVQKLGLGEHKEGEEVFDSHDSSFGMSYDLQTLKTMMECGCDDNKKIEEDKYLHIIKAWVKHVRKTAPNTSVAQSPSQEVSSMVEDSPSSVMQEERNLSYGSYNDSRNSEDFSGRSSARHETEETVARLTYEIKSLNDRNRSLLRQFDGSEEALKDFQSRNQILQSKLDEAVSNLAKLKELEFVNNDLSKMLSETKSMNEDLVRAKERLNREVEKMKVDYDHLDGTLSTTRVERDKFMDQLKSTQVILSQTREDEREARSELEVKLNESRSHVTLMTTDLEEAGSTNIELKATISELEGQLHYLKTDKIFTSTPFRRSNHPVSLLEEIEDQQEEEGVVEEEEEEESQPEGMVNGNHDPDPGSASSSEGEEIRRFRHVESHESPEVESFKKRVNERDVKIQSKTSSIMQELGDLLTPDVSSSFTTTSQVSSTDDQLVVRYKLQGTLREKVKLKKENKNLRKENSDLATRLQQLEVLLEDLQGSNGFGPAHLIQQVIEEDESPISGSSASEVLPSDASPDNTTPSGARVSATDTGYVQTSTYQHHDSEVNTMPQHSQYAFAESSIHTNVIYTSASQDMPVHTSTSSSDSSFNQPPPPPGLSFEIHVQHTHTDLPLANVISTEALPRASGDGYVRIPSLEHGEDKLATSPLPSRDVPVQSTVASSVTTYTDVVQVVPVYTLTSSSGELSDHPPPPEISADARAKAKGSDASPIVSVTSSESFPLRTTEDSYVQTSSYEDSEDVTVSLPQRSNQSSVSQKSPVRPAIPANVIYTSPVQGTPIHPSTLSSGGLFNHPPPPGLPSEVPYEPPNVPVHSQSYTPAYSALLEDDKIPAQSVVVSSTAQASVINRQEFPVISDSPAFQEIVGPDFSAISTGSGEFPSFSDSLEDGREHLEESPITKPVPTTRRLVVTSKEPSSQVDGIGQENSDLPLASYSKDAHSSRSTSPGAVFVRSKERSLVSTDFDRSPSSHQLLSHKRSRSADTFLVDTMRSSSKLNPTVTHGLFSGVEEEEAAPMSTMKLRRSLMLQSEPDALQKAVVGVVNIRPGVNEETGATEEVYGDVISYIHIVPELYDEVDAALTMGVQVKPETEDKETSVDFTAESVIRITSASRWPSLSSVLLNSVMLLFIIVMIMAFLVLVVISHDALERCGTYCPHSPVHFLYATFEPYLQYTKVNTPL